MHTPDKPERVGWVKYPSIAVSIIALGSIPSNLLGWHTMLTPLFEWYVLLPAGAILILISIWYDIRLLRYANGKLSKREAREKLNRRRKLLIKRGDGMLARNPNEFWREEAVEQFNMEFTLWLSEVKAVFGDDQHVAELLSLSAWDHSELTKLMSAIKHITLWNDLDEEGI